MNDITFTEFELESTDEQSVTGREVGLPDPAAVHVDLVAAVRDAETETASGAHKRGMVGGNRWILQHDVVPRLATDAEQGLLQHHVAGSLAYRVGHAYGKYSLIFVEGAYGRTLNMFIFLNKISRREESGRAHIDAYLVLRATSARRCILLLYLRRFSCR